MYSFNIEQKMMDILPTMGLIRIPLSQQRYFAFL